MRKLLIFCAAILATASSFAGGLVTNTNQSAMYTRLQSRNASTSIDAVYYNPAGVSKLGDGFFASVSNQVIGQTRKIKNNYMYLAGTPKEYTGNVSAPLFPSLYLAYNTGKLSFSAGVNPIGGGGGATYEDGLPSFETRVADLVPLLVANGIPASQYSADISFEGQSIYFGYQGNVAYKINDMISVAAGLRLVSASNSYIGYLKNIQANPNYPAFGASYTGGMVPASGFFTAGAAVLNALSTGANTFAAALQPIINQGGGSVLLANGTAVGMTAEQVGQAQQILGATGMTPAQIGAATIAVAQGTFAVAGPQFAAKSGTMTAYAGQTQDLEVDAEQSGTGYTPIISVNITPSDKLNLSLRYEFQTKLELTTTVNNNKGGGIFTNGQKTIADMPAMLAIGAEYRPLDKLYVSASMNMYFDQNVDYDGSTSLNIDMIDKNSTEYALGVEYGLSEKLRASAGWLGTFTGVNSKYQNDQTYSLNTNTIGGGFGYRIAPKIDLNIGGMYTMYKEGSKSFTHLLGTNEIPLVETYNKSTWVISAGLDFYFGK